MRDLIKIIIAIFFMAIAFYFGKYQAEEKCSAQFQEAKEKSIIAKKQIEQLQDSLSIMGVKIVKLTSMQQIDILKVKKLGQKISTQKNK